MDDMTNNDNPIAMLKGSLDDLLTYYKKNNWSGFDLYDGLNSRLYLATPLKKARFAGWP